MQESAAVSATQAHPTMPEDDEAADFLIDVVADHLAAILTDDPAKQAVARRAAERLIAGHAPTDEADLLLTVQMIAFNLAALRSLGLANRPGLSAQEVLRAHTGATGLSRAAERLRLQRARRMPLATRPRQPVEPVPDSAMAPMPAAPDEGARIGVADHGSEDTEAWADAAEDRAQTLLATIAALPPAQRPRVLADVRRLSDAARAVRAGLPVPGIPDGMD